MLERRAFEPEFLRKLERLVLGIKGSRTVRAGQRTVGRVHGIGIELENFKEYAEGDDLRFLDWNAYARLDDLMVRIYRTEREVDITILVDASASMGLPRDDDKRGLALALGASLAYVAMGENDAVRLVAFACTRGSVSLRSTPFYRRREMYPTLWPFVASVETGGETRLDAMVVELLRPRPSLGVVILISDLLVGQSEFEAALTHLLAAGHEVKVIHVMGERESHGTYPPGPYRVYDAESGSVREVVFGPELAEATRRRVAELSQRVSDFCASRDVVYAQAFGVRNLEVVLERELPRLGVVR